MRRAPLAPGSHGTPATLTRHGVLAEECTKSFKFGTGMAVTLRTNRSYARRVLKGIYRCRPHFFDTIGFSESRVRPVRY